MKVVLLFPHVNGCICMTQHNGALLAPFLQPTHCQCHALKSAPPLTWETLLMAIVIPGNPVSYPYSTLVAGVGWPADVDVSAREMYMCASEFQEVFGMNWDAYYALPMWKRRVLRQQHNLF